MTTPQRTIVVALFDGVDLLDVTGPPEVFNLVQRELDEPSGYRVVLAAATMEPITTSARVRLLPDLTFEQAAAGAIDTLIVPGAVEVTNYRNTRATADPTVAAWVRQIAPRARRVASVCVGAHVLAAAGLLAGKRATTHWGTAQQLATEHPEIQVDPDPIFIRDGNVWTGAGLTACLDLSLALVAEDFGREIALRVARNLVMFLQRPGGQSQFSVAIEPAAPTHRLDDLRRYIASHPAAPLTLADLAARARVSERHLSRIFHAEVGMAPAAYVERARVESARARLETTGDTLERVAGKCGFGTTDTLTRAFRRHLGTTPAQYRARFRVVDPAIGR